MQKASVLKKIFLLISMILLSINITYANTDVDFGPYMRELQRRIKLNWEPPKTGNSKSVVVSFSITRDGRLFNEKILVSCGNLEYDNNALYTIRSTAPFRPLPVNFTGDKVDVQFTLDYNMIGASTQNKAPEPQRQYNPIEKPIEKPIEEKETNKKLNNFNFEYFKEKYNFDYDAIRMIAISLAILILGLIFIPNANRK